MLIVADQGALVVGRERCLSGTGQTEEQGNVAVMTDVGRAVHRHHAQLRHQVVQHGKDRLLVLACIGGATDQHKLLRKAQDDEDLRRGAVDLGDSLELRNGHHGKARGERRKLFCRGLDEHVLHEQRVVGMLLDETNIQSILLVGAGDQVLHIDVAALQVGRDASLQGVELLFGERAVHLAPPHIALGIVLFNHEFVVRPTSGIRHRVHGESAVLRQDAFAIRDGVLIQVCGREVVIDLAKVSQTCCFKCRTNGINSGAHCGFRFGDNTKGQGLRKYRAF